MLPFLLFLLLAALGAVMAVVTGDATAIVFAVAAAVVGLAFLVVHLRARRAAPSDAGPTVFTDSDMRLAELANTPTPAEERDMRMDAMDGLAAARPGRVPPHTSLTPARPAPAPAPVQRSRRFDDDDSTSAALLGLALSSAHSPAAPFAYVSAPATESEPFRSGGGGDYAGGGASASWGDSGGSSSSGGSDSGGSSSGD